MSLQEVNGPPLPTEDTALPPRLDKEASTINREPHTATADTISVVDDPAEEVDSEFGEPDTEFVPGVYSNTDSDDDITGPQTEDMQEGDLPEATINELHEEFQDWEKVFLTLEQKKKAGGSLTPSQKKKLEFAREALQELLGKMPASDPRKSSCAETLGHGKRKIEDEITSQSKKARRAVPIHVDAPDTRKEGRRAKSTSQHKSPPHDIAAQKQAPVTRQQGTEPPPIDRQVAAEIQRFKAQAPEDMNAAHLKSEAIVLRNAAQRVGSKLESVQDGRWDIKNMSSHLFPYQLDALGWAMRQENCRLSAHDHNAHGGILADGMGVGKTITMLALSVTKPAPRSGTVKADLLVVPNAQMAAQWESQIQKHCEDLDSIRYNLKHFNKKVPRKSRIIVATYNEIERASGRLSTEKEEDSDKLLFKTTFHRLILDECHTIKDHTGARAKAVFKLKAKFQWLISATPSPNSRDEYYSYLKVLGLRDTDSFSAFKRYWYKAPSDSSTSAETNLQAGLERFQLRRTGLTAIAGVKIFADVPENHEEDRKVTLFDDERVIYSSAIRSICNEIRKRQKQLAAGEFTVAEDSDEDRILDGNSKIMQLRMLTAHPYLAERLMQSEAFMVDQRQDIRLAFQQTDKPSLKQIDGYIEKVETKSLDMDLQLEYNLGKGALQRKCHSCPGETIPLRAVKAECGHVWCLQHFDQLIEFWAFKHQDAPVLCTVCRAPIGVTEHVDQADIIEARAKFTARSATKGGREPKGDKPKKRGDDFNGYQPKGDRSEWLALNDKTHPKGPLVHSIKTFETLKTVKGWQSDAPEDKIIIFTQWITMGRILGRHLEDAGINYLYYFGDMTEATRTKCLKTFEHNDKVQVVIMGLKCAGVGLDLYYANRVIIVDPYWNKSVEEQAFARVYRKIQKKKTYFVRLIARDSLDMRVGDIKQAKDEKTECLMKEDDPLRRQSIEVGFLIKLSKLLDDDFNEDKEEAEAPEVVEGKEAANQPGAPKKRKIQKIELKVPDALKQVVTEPSKAEPCIKQEYPEGTMEIEMAAPAAKDGSSAATMED